MMRSAPCFALATLLVIAGLAAPSHAQLCFGPDNLSGPCCSFNIANLPTPMPTPPTMPASGICWTACSPATTNVFLSYTPITQLACGSYSTGLSVIDTAGTVIMRGTMTLDYTRTWAETNFAGDPLQCWRFMAKVDLFASAPGLPCPVPAGTAPTSFYYGYLDVVLNCNTGGFEFANVLFHSCDLFIHNPAVSSIPGPHHPASSYALVAPVTAANPFLPLPLPPIFGPVTGGATRLSALPGATCLNDELIPAGGANLGLIAQACACPFNLAGPLQYSAQPFTGTSICGTGTASIWTPFPLPWLHLITTSLGFWTGGGPGTPYPGPEAAFVNEGFFFTTDGCFGIPFIQVYYGAMTDQGFPVTPDAARPWQTPRMLDLASNYSRSMGITPPFVGTVRPTARLIYVNF